jgi:GNAT superfamily N-acetyltransferase
MAIRWDWTGRLLPYDKDRRWADRKDEQVLPAAIIQEPSLAMIPTLRTGRGACIRVYIYCRQPQGALNRAAELGRRLCERHAVEKGRLTWFLPPGSNPDPVAACTRAGCGMLAEKLTAEGFAFLDTRIRSGGTGPVLTVQRHSTIVGAIGPMEIMPDSRGAAQLLPQYFGVLPEYRGHGLGRSLWRAAMHWGPRHWAAYQLLQTQVGGASDLLC